LTVYELFYTVYVSLFYCSSNLVRNVILSSTWAEREREWNDRVPPAKGMETDRVDIIREQSTRERVRLGNIITNSSNPLIVIFPL